MTTYNITGWGKGKTTSAIGIAARALMNNERVLFVQFLKDRVDLGIKALERLNQNDFYNHFLYLPQGTRGLVKEDCTKFWEDIKQVIDRGGYNLIVLDEFNVAIDHDLIDEPINEIITYLKMQGLKGVDIYITGRLNNHKIRHQMLAASDVFTNCFSGKHVFNKGCNSCGMEFSRHYEYCPMCGVKLDGGIEAKAGREC